MMKDREKDLDDDLREEYDFSGAVRGKYAARYAEGVTFHILPPASLDDSKDSDAPGEAAPDVSS